jgi:hypothetical protein
MSAPVEENRPAEEHDTAVPRTPETAEKVLQTKNEEGGSISSDDTPIDPKAERKLVMKLDLVIYPVFFVIYMMSFLDRINISNARIQGMARDLELTGHKFNISLFVCGARDLALQSGRD